MCQDTCCLNKTWIKLLERTCTKSTSKPHVSHIQRILAWRWENGGLGSTLLSTLLIHANTRCIPSRFLWVNVEWDITISKLRFETNQHLQQLDRIFYLCHSQKLEMEAHLIFRCLLYYEIKGRYYCLFQDSRDSLSTFFCYPKQNALLSSWERFSGTDLNVHIDGLSQKPSRGSPCIYWLTRLRGETNHSERPKILKAQIGEILSFLLTPTPRGLMDLLETYEDLLQITGHTPLHSTLLTGPVKVDN